MDEVYQTARSSGGSRKYRNSPRRPPATSYMELVCMVCKLVLQYPAHLVRELGFYVLPLISSLVPAIAVGLVMRMQAEQLLPISEPRTMENISMSDDLESTERALTLIPQGLMDLSTLLTTVSLCCALWAWKAVRPALLAVALPSFLGIVVLTAVNVHLHLDHSSPWYMVEQSSVFVLQGALIAGTLFYVGSFTHNQLVMRVYGVLVLVVIILYVLCRALAGSILRLSDAHKAFFCAVLNPAIFEVLITGARMVARGVKKNHSSTSFMLVAPIISLKHIVGRFVTAMIRSNDWVLFVSVCSGAGELLLSTTMPSRDAKIYWWLFRPFLRSSENPDKQMQNSRNRALRMNNAMFETMSELVATWSGAAMVYTIGISREKHFEDAKVPEAMDLVKSALIQTGIEVAVDLVSIILVFVIHRYDMLKLAKRRRWLWSLPVCPFLMLSSALLSWSLLSRILCLTEGKEEVIWRVCPDS
jgi:hypothetical protein